jgi:hypothetical protein
MPILKKKLAKSLVKTEPGTELSLKAEELSHLDNISLTTIVKKEEEKPTNGHIRKIGRPKQTYTGLSAIEIKKKANSSKNIVKNYGRTMVTFAISNIALPYIKDKLREENLDYKDFKEYLGLRKETMDGISSLRALLLITEDDDETVMKIKRVFMHSSVMFVKYFSVNWIFNSKLGDKGSYVKSRFKMLRRITDPEHFTYFKL